MAESLQWTKRINQEKVEEVYYKNFGQAYIEYRRQWNLAGKDFLPKFPVHLDFEVVDACNLLCLYCFRNKEVQERIGVKMNTGVCFPLETFKRIMQEGCRYGLKAVNFGFSGECLINPDLIEMVNAAMASGVLDIRLLTNGTLMTKDIADMLLDSPLTLLSFSVDAGTSKTYRRLKGKDYFNKLYETVSYTYNKRNELRKDLPLLRASFYPSPESENEKDIFLERFKGIVDFIDFQDFKDIRKVKNHVAKTDCHMPFKRLAIFANGDVAPCCSFFSKKLIVGNVKKSTLKEIWDSPRMQVIREGLGNNTPVEVCGKCLDTIG